jgi:PIN domain nuclease of toxin-antitoxin system
MKFLLDTSIFLFSLDAFHRLNDQAQKVLAGGEEIYLSSASSWEIVVKHGIGKLRLPKPPTEVIRTALIANAIRAIPITLSHSLALQGLPWHHKDPFDRMLVAQAQHEGMVLMTEDDEIRRYPVEILWCGR